MDAAVYRKPPLINVISHSTRRNKQTQSSSTINIAEFLLHPLPVPHPPHNVTRITRRATNMNMPSSVPVRTPKVTLMPQDGETFAGALDALEARCRSETRLLYESEDKEDLLGEGGVPESLKKWLQESRGRALNEGGHREGAQRRLREQVGWLARIFQRPFPPASPRRARSVSGTTYS